MTLIESTTSMVSNPNSKPEDFEDIKPLFKKFSLYKLFSLAQSKTFAPTPNKLFLMPLEDGEVLDLLIMQQDLQLNLNLIQIF